MHVEPYLFFAGRCREAIDFYRDAIGAEATYVMQFKDAPEKSSVPPEWEDKIMHATLTIGQTQFMLSDGTGAEEGIPFKGFSLALTTGGNAEGERLLKALANGGSIDLPFQQTFWSSGFGMVTDKFGVLWMISVETRET